jgi:putative lipoic acid-binding regulatory protein
MNDPRDGAGGPPAAAGASDASVGERVGRIASLLEFPTDFPIKIMGARVDAFSESMVAVVKRHAPDFDPSTLEMRASRQGNYLSVTATIRATSREQLDALYRELTSHPLVKVVL